MAQNNNIVCNFKTINDKLIELQKQIEECQNSIEQNDEAYTVEVVSGTSDEYAIQSVKRTLMENIPVYWSSFWSKGAIEFSFEITSENSSEITITCPVGAEDSEILEAVVIVGYETDVETGERRLIIQQVLIVTNNTNFDDQSLESDLTSLFLKFETQDTYGATSIDYSFLTLTLGE